MQPTPQVPLSNELSNMNNRISEIINKKSYLRINNQLSSSKKEEE